MFLKHRRVMCCLAYIPNVRKERAVTDFHILFNANGVIYMKIWCWSQCIWPTMCDTIIENIKCKVHFEHLRNYCCYILPAHNKSSFKCWITPFELKIIFCMFVFDLNFTMKTVHENFALLQASISSRSNPITFPHIESTYPPGYPIAIWW